MQTHLVSNIMHQNPTVILWQFNYGKNSLIVFVPTSRYSRYNSMQTAPSFLLLKNIEINKQDPRVVVIIL